MRRKRKSYFVKANKKLLRSILKYSFRLMNKRNTYWLFYIYRSSNSKNHFNVKYNECEFGVSFIEFDKIKHYLQYIRNTIFEIH